MQQTEYKIRYSLLKIIRNLLFFVHFPVMYVLSDISFYILYYLIRYRRRITRKNLTESFPEKTRQEMIAIEKQFYRFFVDLLFEICKMASCSEQEMRRRMRFVNIEEVNQMLDSGKSISIFMGHYGNWEWASSLPLHLSKQVVAGQIYHRLSNHFFDRLLLRNRSRWGAQSIEMNQTLRWITAHTGQGQITITGYIADQAPGYAHAQHHVHFLNHLTPAVTGAEKITRKYGFEAYYLDMERKRRGFYEARFVRIGETSPSLADFQLTDRYFELLEETIRKRPEFYLWTHNRFKHATTKLLQEINL